jgi:tripartite motif-containing protein 71
MLTVRRITFMTLAAGAFLVLSGCPSPFLTAIKQAIADAPFTGVKSYSFVRQWGNGSPQYSFNNPVVKTDTAGFVYVADSTYRIQKYTGAGALQSTVAGISSKGTSARIYDMAFDAFGNMYVTTNDTYVVQKYDVNGNRLAQWATSTDLYPPTTGSAISNPRGIAVDNSGNVYVVDYGNHRVVMFNSSGTYLYDWGGGSTQYNSLTLSGPTGIAVDSSNYVYLADYNNHRVCKFLIGAGPTATYVAIDWGTTLQYNSLYMYAQWIAIGKVGSATYIFVTDPSNRRVLQFSTSGANSAFWGDSTVFTSMKNLAVDTSGYVYVADGSSSAGRLQKFNVSPTPTLIAAWGGALSTADGQFGMSWGTTFDTAGNVLVTDTANCRVQKFSPDGTFLAKWGSAGSGAGQLNMPTGITVNSAGKVIVCDAGNARYQVFDESGNSLAAVGSSGSGVGQFALPCGVATDSTGNVYIADTANCRVQVFSSNGYFLRQWGSAGIGNGQFQLDYGVAFDAKNGWIYVSDFLGNRVEKFDLQGNFISAMGSFGNGDGQFSTPIGLTVDSAGNLFVCDMMNHRIQKFDSSGNFLTKFGTAGGGNGGMAWPTGVAVDSKGNVVVSDYAMSLVQEFSPSF